MDLCLLSNEQNNWECWILALSFVGLHWKGLWECTTTTASNWEDFLRERLEAAAALIFLQVYFQWCWAILPCREVCDFSYPNSGTVSLTSTTSTGSAVFYVPWRDFWMFQVFKCGFFFFSLAKYCWCVTRAELQNSECRAESGAQTVVGAPAVAPSMLSPWAGHSSVAAPTLLLVPATDGHEFIFKSETFCILWL